MTQQIINTGSGPDTLKVAFGKANSNYAELYALLSKWQTTNLVLEGHSFFEEVIKLTGLIKNRLTPSSFYDSHESGGSLTGVINRGVTVDSKILPEVAGLRNVLILYIGANDLAIDQTAAVKYATLKSYVQTRRSAGWKMFIYTTTPATAAGRGESFESERVIYNDLIRNDLSLLNNVYILDTDTIALLNNPANAIYYSDLIHPTPIGSSLLSDLLTDKISSVEPQLVINYELSTNGGFDTNSGWTLGANWSISNGKLIAEAAASDSFISQSVLTIVGKTYRIKYIISDYASGVFHIEEGSGSWVTAANGNGSYAYDVVCTIPGTIYLQGIGGVCSFKVDDFSIKAI